MHVRYFLNLSEEQSPILVYGEGPNSMLAPRGMQTFQKEFDPLHEWSPSFTKTTRLVG